MDFSGVKLDLTLLLAVVKKSSTIPLHFWRQVFECCVSKFKEIWKEKLEASYLNHTAWDHCSQSVLVFWILAFHWFSPSKVLRISKLLLGKMCQVSLVFLEEPKINTEKLYNNMSVIQKKNVLLGKMKNGWEENKKK